MDEKTKQMKTNEEINGQRNKPCHVILMSGMILCNVKN